LTNLALNSAQLDIFLKIIQGNDSGAVYQMTAASLTIGRAEENDIVLNDPKTSRMHAKLEWDEQGLKVTNLSSKASLIINGVEAKQGYLDAGSIITIGNTNIELAVENPIAVAPQAETAPTVNQTTEQKKRSPIFYILLLMVAAIMYLALSGSEEQAADQPLRDNSMIQKEIEETQKITEGLQNAKFTSGKDTKQYQDARESYLKGFRDYREGNYPRAITSFEAALALYPQHPLAQQYLALSRRKLDETIQAFMQDGNRFMDKGKYRQAVAAYQTVMTLIRDKTNPNYQEAYAKHRQSKAILEASY